MSTVKAVRYHDICMGHRVVGHESKCAHLHGHNYRIHFHCESLWLDDVGRVVDFSVIKSKLCEWLEENWDHKFLYWCKDTLITGILNAVPGDSRDSRMLNDIDTALALQSFVCVPFNPTAENIGLHLLNHVCPELLKDAGFVVTKIIIEETRKCSVEVSDAN